MHDIDICGYDDATGEPYPHDWRDDGSQCIICAQPQDADLEATQALSREAAGLAPRDSFSYGR